MTHAESHELLLDLAYGELAPEQEQEVLGHVSTCADCQREKAALDEARRLTAPLRGLDEPSPGFDEKILAAARAQAQMEHGQLGQVIEVSGSVRPMGMEPARIDALKAATPRAIERRRPRWVTRVALGGSVAAAAALALVVSTTLQTKQAEERAAKLASDKAFQIQVQPAPVAVAENEALKTARQQAEAKPAAQPPADTLALLQQRKDAAGSGGDVGSASGVGAISGGKGADRLAKAKQAQRDEKRAVDDLEEAAAPPPPPPAPVELQKAQPPAVEALRAQPPPPAPVVAQKLEAPPKEAASAGAAVAAAKPPAMHAAPETAPAANEPKAESRAAAKKVAMAAPSGAAVPAAAVEADAQRARHAGQYGLAAQLYQQAAQLPRAPSDAAESPAWDLAHAVECLSAAGMFDEARQVRDRLAQTYPDEKTAYLAAGRALREVDGVAGPPAKGPASRPPAKAKAEPSKNTDEAVPADF